MNLTDHFRSMARSNAWSNYRLHKACAQLSPAEFTAERVSFFPSLHLTLRHILIVDWYYIDDTKKVDGLAMTVFPATGRRFQDLGKVIWRKPKRRAIIVSFRFATG